MMPTFKKLFTIVNEERGSEFEKLTPLEKQGIYDLENSDLYIQSKMLILGAFLGVKPFSEAGEQVADNEKEIIEKENKFEIILNRLGLKFRKERTFYSSDAPEVKVFGYSPNTYRTSYIIGKALIPELTINTMQFIKPRVEEPVGIEQYHRELGELVGIPKTAIDGWFLDQSDEEFEQILSQTSEEARKFRWFGYSSEHWQEEVKIVEDFAQKVKSVSPKLYREILKTN